MNNYAVFQFNGETIVLTERQFDQAIVDGLRCRCGDCLDCRAVEYSRDSGRWPESGTNSLPSLTLTIAGRRGSSTNIRRTALQTRCGSIGALRRGGFEVNTSTPKDRPQLGTRVRFNAVAKREYEGKRVRWVSTPINSNEGIYTGYRLKHNGVLHYGAYGDPSYLQRTSTVSLALVVTQERKNPTLVPWDALEW